MKKVDTRRMQAAEMKMMCNKKLHDRFRYSFICQDLDQETAKGPFRSSSQAATCYYQSNYSKVEPIPLSALSKDTTSELADISPH